MRGRPQPGERGLGCWKIDSFADIANIHNRRRNHRAELEALVAEHNGLVQATSEESTRVRSQARLRETRALSKVNVLQEQVLATHPITFIHSFTNRDV